MRFCFVKDPSKWYNIDEGSTLTENYNETLDSANVRVSHLTEEIDIEPFDDVILQDEDGRLVDRYMCVDSYESTQEGLDTPTYTYSISLFSQTKKLENIILPNLSITPRRNLSSRRTIFNFLMQYLREYGDENWSFATRVSTKFTDYAPELQWNKPSFREVLTDLMMVKDCIPILRNDVIDYIDLTVSQDLGNKTGINYIRKSQSSEDYVSEIRMELQNVMQTSVEGINNVVTTTEYIPFTSDDWRVTTENLYLKTQFPILRVNHLWICLFPYSYEDSTWKQRMIKADLCNLKTNASDTGGSLLKESKEFETMPILYRTDLAKTATVSQFADYNVDDYFSQKQNYCIHYTRGTNRIEGFGATSKQVWYAIGDSNTLEWIKNLAIVDAEYRGEIDLDASVPNFINSIENPLEPVIELNRVTYYSTFFQIEYETTYNALFSASKENKPHNSRIMSDNQTNSWVDIYSQGFLEYQKANRLGNKNLLINQRVKGNDLIVIGDKYNDNVVYRTEYQIYKNHIEVNAFATKYYILQNYFTSIKSKVRTWVNAKDEAFERHDLVKLYCELSDEETQDESIGNVLSNYLLSPLKSGVTSPIKYVGVKTTKNRFADNPVWYGLYSLNCTTRLVGKSIVLTFGFDDNWFVGKYVYSYEDPLDSSKDEGIIRANINQGNFGEDGQGRPLWYPPWIRTAIGDALLPTTKYGGIPLNNYRYTDENGEFTSINYLFAEDITLVTEEPTTTTADITETQIKDLFQAVFDLPKVMDNAFFDYIRYEQTLDIRKDNKEIPIISTQFEFRTSKQDIIITENFVKEQQMIRNVDLTTGGEGQNPEDYGYQDRPNLKIYVSNVLQSTLPVPSNDNGITLNAITGAFLDYDFLGASSSRIDFNYGSYQFGTDEKYIYVCDDDNNVLFSFSKRDSLYLNIRRKL